MPAPSPELDAIFGALADPTRRQVLQTLMERGSVSAPTLAGELPISRQAVAKHLQVLGDAGLIERGEVTGREVHYHLSPRALAPVTDWLAAAQAAWPDRLERLRRAAERGS